MFDKRVPYLDNKGRVRFRVTFGYVNAINSWAVSVWVVCKQEELKYFYSDSDRTSVRLHERYPVDHYNDKETRAALIRMYGELFMDKLEQNGYRGYNMRHKELSRWAQEQEKK